MTDYLCNHWALELSIKARKDMHKLEKQVQKQIADYFDKNILNLVNPRTKGKPLSGKLAGQWRYRVGNYRIICEIKDAKMVVLAISIGHRREVYKT